MSRIRRRERSIRGPVGLAHGADQRRPVAEALRVRRWAEEMLDGRPELEQMLWASISERSLAKAPTEDDLAPLRRSLGASSLPRGK